MDRSDDRPRRVGVDGTDRTRVVWWLLGLALEPVLLWFPLLFLLLALFGLDPVVRYLVRPTLTGQETSAGLMLVAYLLGAAVFGWYGVFLASLLLVVTLRFVTVILPPLVHGHPILYEYSDRRGDAGSSRRR